MEQNNWKDLSPWELEIINAFPDIYLGREESSDNSFHCNLRFGFECGSGWQVLLKEFSQTVDDLVKKLRTSGLQPDAHIYAWVVKEKFGLLRWSGENNLVEPFRELLLALEWQLEERSKSVCEISGERGELREIHGWWSVLSDSEYKKALERKLAEE